MTKLLMYTCVPLNWIQANKILCYSPQKPKRFDNSLLCAGNASRTGEERVIQYYKRQVSCYARSTAY